MIDWTRFTFIMIVLTIGVTIPNLVGLIDDYNRKQKLANYEFILEDERRLAFCERGYCYNNLKEFRLFYTCWKKGLDFKKESILLKECYQ